MEINLVCGTNFYLIENFISEIKNNSEFEFERINSEFISREEIRNHISTYSMFSENKFVVIDSLLSKIASQEKEGSWEGFFDNIKSDESSNVIYIVEKIESEKDLNSLIRRNIFKSVDFIKKEFNLPTGRGSFEKINNWVSSKEKEYGLNLSKSQKSVFIYDSNKDYILIENELLKLANFSKGNEILEDDFNKIISITKNYKIFDLLDSFFLNKQKELSLSINNLLSSGITVVEITSMIATEMHKILLIKYLLNENKNNSEISKITGISSTFYFNKLLNTSRKISMKRLKNIHNSLLEFDLKCKTMNFEKELELELLLITN